MILCKRDKIIEIPMSFIHLVPEGSGYSYDPILGGIVVERIADDRVFAIKLFQKLFVRMSWSAIKCEDRKLIVSRCLINEGIASLMSRQFFEETIKGNSLFANNETINQECFNIEAEKVFNGALDNFWERSHKSIPKETFSFKIIGAAINGSFPSW